MAVLTAPSPVSWSPNPELIRMANANPIAAALDQLADIPATFQRGVVANIDAQRNLNNDVLSSIRTEAAANQAYAGTLKLNEEAAKLKALNDAGIPVRSAESEMALREAQTNQAKEQTRGLGILNANALREQNITLESDDLNRRLTMLQQTDPAKHSIIMKALADPARRAYAVDMIMKETGYKPNYLNLSEIYDTATKGTLKADTSGYDRADSYYAQLENNVNTWSSTPDPITGLAAKDFTSKDVDINGLEVMVKNLGANEKDSKTIANDLRTNLPGILATYHEYLPEGAKNLPRNIQAKILLASMRRTDSDYLPQWIKFLNDEHRVADNTIIDTAKLNSLAEAAIKQYKENGADYEYWKEGGKGRTYLQNERSNLLRQKNKSSAFEMDERTGTYKAPPTEQELISEGRTRMPVIGGLNKEQNDYFYTNLTNSLLFGQPLPSIARARQYSSEEQNTAKTTPQDTATTTNEPQQQTAAQAETKANDILAAAKAGMNVVPQGEIKKWSPQVRQLIKSSTEDIPYIKEAIDKVEQQEAIEARQQELESQIDKASTDTLANIIQQTPDELFRTLSQLEPSRRQEKQQKIIKNIRAKINEAQKQNQYANMQYWRNILTAYQAISNNLRGASPRAAIQR